MSLIGRIRALPLLRGGRGAKGLSFDALAEAMVRISRLVVDAPLTAKIDISPLMGSGYKLFAVDARRIVRA